MMKQSCFLLAAMMALILPTTAVRAQDDSPAAVAAREAAEERDKRINTRIEDLEKAVHKYQERLSSLNDELRNLRDELGHLRESNNDSQTKENFKRLKEAIEEVDKKRLEDNKKVMSAFDELRTLITKSVASAPPARSPSNTGPMARSTAPKRDTESGYEYAVVDKDTLSGIISKLRQRNIKATQKQIMDANPDVNWNKLHIGQKIFIPSP
jgi:DNA repair exonuclease SbcCD ATPase subunit